MKIIESFFWGAITAMVALAVEAFILTLSTIFSGNYELPLSATAWSFGFIVIGSVIEEIFKFLVILKKFIGQGFTRTAYLPILFFGLGFGAAELILITVNPTLSDANFLNNLALILIHILTALIIGAVLLIRTTSLITKYTLAIFAASFVHLAYNAMVWYTDIVEVIPIVTILVLIIFFTATSLFYRKKVVAN